MGLNIKEFTKDIIHFRFKSILSRPWHLLVLSVFLVIGHNIFYALGTITDFLLVGFVEVVSFILSLIVILLFLIALFKKSVYLFFAILIAFCSWGYYRTGHLPFLTP